MRTITIKRKRLAMLTLFVLLVIGIVAIQTATGTTNEQTTYETNRLILELDMIELPDFIGKNLEVNFTAVTKAETVTVSMYFDGMTSNPIWEETADFFVNERVTINVENAELAPGMGHEFTIYAEDSLGESDSISKTMTVDTVNPEFNFLSLEHIDKSGYTTLITDNYAELRENEQLRLNWSVYDENFLKVSFFIDDRTDLESYPASASKSFGPGHFSIELIDVTEQKFTLTIIAFDKADNFDSYSWSVVKYEPEDDSVPKEKYDQLKAEQEAENKLIGRRAGICAILGTLTGAIIAVIGVVSFIKTSGYQKVIDSDKSIGHDDDYFNRNREQDEKGLGDTKTKKVIQKLQKEKEEREKEEQEPTKEKITEEQISLSKKKKRQEYLWILVASLLSGGLLTGSFTVLFISNTALAVILFVLCGISIVAAITLTIILLDKKRRKE